MKSRFKIFNIKKHMISLAIVLIGVVSYAKVEQSIAKDYWQKAMSAMMSGQMDKAYLYLDTMEMIAIRDNDVYQLATSYNNRAEIAFMKRDYIIAKKYYQKSIPLFEQADSIIQAASVYTRLGNIKQAEGDIDSALYFANLAKRQIPNTTNKMLARAVYNDLAVIMSNIGKIDSSMYYQIKLLKASEGASPMILSSVYNNLASYSEQLGNHDDERTYLYKSLEYAKDLNMTKAKILVKIAVFHTVNRDYDKAIEFGNQGIEIIEDHNKEHLRLEAYVVLATAYLKKGNINKAKQLLQKIRHVENEKNLEQLFKYYNLKLAIAMEEHDNIQIDHLLVKTEKIAERIGFLSPLVKVYNQAIKRYEELNEYNKANLYFHKLQVVLDSINRKDARLTANNLEKKYLSKQKQLKINLLNQENTIKSNAIEKQKTTIWVGGLVLLLISLFSFFMYRLYQKVVSQKAQLNKALKEKEVLLREIHHRVKNNLQLISSLLTLQGRSIEDEMAIKAINDGRSRVRSMALIHQDLYNKENLTEISVKDYIQKLSQELLRTYSIDNKKISLKMDIEDIDLDVDIMVPLGLIINELVTNSLKYAFVNRDDGEIKITLNKKGKSINVSLSDNGIGYDLSKTNSSSFGSVLIEALSSQLEATLSIDAENGTKTDIRFDV